VHVVGISSQAAGHKTLIPELVKLLSQAGAGHMLVVAGGVIPPKDYQFLYDNGVSAIFGPGTRVVEACSKLVQDVDTTLDASGL